MKLRVLDRDRFMAWGGASGAVMASNHELVPAPSAIRAVYRTMRRAGLSPMVARACIVTVYENGAGAAVTNQIALIDGLVAAEYERRRREHPAAYGVLRAVPAVT